MPKQNEKDLEDIPDEIKEKVKFIFVDHVDQALELLLLKK
jgi:ATP-dependent Lon protease